MDFLRCIALLVLLPAGCFVPGYLLVRKLKFRPLEILCASIAASLILIYLTAFLVYVSGIDWRWCWLFSAGAALAAIALARELWRFFAIRPVRRALLAFTAILAAAICFQGLVVHYSGGAWAADWLEHYER